MTERSNIFISHIHADDHQLQDMKDLLARSDFHIRDASINSSRPNNARNEEYIKSSILAPRIRWAGTMVVLITPETRHSEWVNWEIKYAAQLGKRIVGVYANGAAECDVPDNLDKYGDAIVGWRGGRIIDAISGDLDTYEKPDGSRHDARPITRYSC
jgi:hypothetical protein